MNTSEPGYVESASTLAVIALSNEPLVYLSQDLRVIATSASFCRSFGLTPATVTGKLLSELGNGEWAIPQLNALLKATASGLAAVEMYETSLVRPHQPPRGLVVNAHRIADEEALHIRLLVAINDVTIARAESMEKEALIRHNKVLLQEIQHRVANSLQIIASVLMQSARRVQSDEARGHLRDAHSRVMSISAVQRLLAASTLDDVVMGAYLRQLCESLGASMISDPEKLRIVVNADDSKMTADHSVSLGLIVTDFVINALKHAFSEDKPGCVTVDFHTEASRWTLSVTDDGSGMPKGPDVVPGGLGTSIVKALATQLNAEISIVDKCPGTSVRIVQTSDSNETNTEIAA